MKLNLETNIKKDPIVDRPISTMRGRILIGTLIIGYAAYVSSSVGILKNTPYINFSYVGLLLAMLIVGYLFFKYSHPLDHARWKQFHNGFFMGYLPVYLGLTYSLNSSGFVQAFAHKLQPDFVTGFVYFAAAGYGCLAGYYKISRSDANEKFKLVCTMKDFRAIQPLFSYLRSDNVKFRRQAAIELGELGDERGVPGLLRAIKDKDWRVQMNAIKSLVKLDDPRAVQPLLTILEHGKPSMQQRAAKALGGLDKSKSVEPLLTALKTSQKGFVRASIVQALGNLDDVQVFLALKQARHDRNLAVRLAAAEAMKKYTSVPVSTSRSKKGTPPPAPAVIQHQSPQIKPAQIEPQFLDQAVPSVEPVRRHKIALPAVFRRLARPVRRTTHRRHGWFSRLTHPERASSPSRPGAVRRSATPVPAAAAPTPAEDYELDKAIDGGQAGNLPIPAEWCEIERLADYDVQTPPTQTELAFESAPQSACTYEPAINPVASTSSSMHEF